ncbi:CsgBAC operon transcriptional regulatory protein [Altererythrobacter insulae]|nr:CsgBAC operon transcriptional regulatory protein [Altererythrobacter insulae]
MTGDLCLLSMNDISREGLHRILNADGFDVVLSCRRSQRVVETQLSTDVSIVIDLPNQAERLSAIHDIAQAYPHGRIAVLVDEFDMDKLVECFDAGCDGYIVKTMNSQPMITALRLVTLGQKVLPSELADVIGKHSFDRPVAHGNFEHEMEVAKLSSRERDVLCCLMAGYPNKVIARELDVCEATVKVHVKAILRKLDVSNRTQAAIWASTRGFLDFHAASQALPEPAVA